MNLCLEVWQIWTGWELFFYLNLDLYAFPLAVGARDFSPGRQQEVNWMVVGTALANIIWIDIAMALYVLCFGLCRPCCRPVATSR